MKELARRQKIQAGRTAVGVCKKIVSSCEECDASDLQSADVSNRLQKIDNLPAYGIFRQQIIEAENERLTNWREKGNTPSDPVTQG